MPPQVSFNVSVEARGCPAPGTQHSFTIRPVGFKDRLQVSASYSCDCGCTPLMEPNSSRCASAGAYTCGVCLCEPGYLGRRCECRDGETTAQQMALCREADGKQPCSGRGDCSCDQCLCYESEFGRIYGAYCECDDFSCARHKGVLCSGGARTRGRLYGLTQGVRGFLYNLPSFSESPTVRMSSDQQKSVGTRPAWQQSA